MSVQRAPLSLLSCKSGETFAKKIVKHLNKKREKKEHVLDSQEVIFANTEIKSVVNESIRGRDVFIVQDVENHTEGMSVDENLRALYTMVDACKRCDAEKITAVIPSYPYARQDKQDGREGITASRIAWELEGDFGIDHILTIDLHNAAIQGFFRRAQIDNLRGSYILKPHLAKLIKDPTNTVIMPTDLGGAKRANHYAQCLSTDIAFSYKKRNYCVPNSVDSVAVLGDLKGKDVYIVDDMICTGGTLTRTIEVVHSMDVNSITAVCTLALLNGPAIERFDELYQKGYIKKVIGTDATYHSPEFLKEYEWFEEVSVAEYFAEIVNRINTRKSIGDLLD